MKLPPLMSYFGSKYRSASKYPAPLHNKVIEPFCGGAGYSLNHAERDITLLDKDERTIAVWNWLIHAKPHEILALPSKIWHTNELPDSLPEEAKLWVGNWLKKSTAQVWKNEKRSPWSLEDKTGHWSENIKVRTAANLKYIRHWKAIHGSYEDLPDEEATWFIDPPYQAANLRKCYRESEIDFEHLGNWCQSRTGAVIVCEQYPANWLPFRSLALVQSSNNRAKSNFSHEVIYTQGF